jgi:hypothetical protein
MGSRRLPAAQAQRSRNKCNSALSPDDAMFRRPMYVLKELISREQSSVS